MSGPWYRTPSIYAQKMKRLGCKIFGEYYRPPDPPDLGALAAKPDGREASPWILWREAQYQNKRIIERFAKPPWDIDDTRNYKYYPAHPQIRELMFTLRLHGLFRDEHLDFIDEMKRLRILRGKRYRVKGGGGGKRSAIKEDKK